MGNLPCGLIRYQQFHDHALSRSGTVVGRVDLHPRGGFAQAGGSQHTLPFDLNHAGAAVAVGPIARRRRVAQVRDIAVPQRCATCQMVSSGPASTSFPSRVKRVVSVMRSPREST